MENYTYGDEAIDLDVTVIAFTIIPSACEYTSFSCLNLYTNNACTDDEFDEDTHTFTY